MGLYGFADIEDAYVAKQMVTERRASPRLRQGTFLAPLPDTSGGAFVAVAITTDIIPARVGDVPGGPIDCVLQSSIGGAAFTDGVTVPVHSWVKTPSADPADEDGGELYIFVAQDLNGMWWFIAQDCTDTPAQVVNQTGTTVDPILATPGSSMGLSFTVPVEGIFQITGDVTLDMSAVGQNEDIGVNVYATVDGVQVGTGLATWVYKTAGAIQVVNWSFYLDFAEADIGKTVDFLVERLTAQVGLIAANPQQQYMGPIK